MPNSGSLSTPTDGAEGIAVPLLPIPFALAQGFIGLPPPLESSHLTVPLVSPKIIVFGLAAAGNAGKASVAVALALPATGAAEDGRDGAGDGLDEDEGPTQGVGPTRPAPALLAEAAGIEGKGVAEALPQLPCLLTSERDDWAVEFFSLRTRLPPVRAAAADEPGRTLLEPGKEG